MVEGSKTKHLGITNRDQILNQLQTLLNIMNTGGAEAISEAILGAGVVATIITEAGEGMEIDKLIT